MLQGRGSGRSCLDSFEVLGFCFVKEELKACQSARIGYGKMLPHVVDADLEELL